MCICLREGHWWWSWREDPMGKKGFLIGKFLEEKVWIGREGVQFLWRCGRCWNKDVY
jgi:hypothetical protein